TCRCATRRARVSSTKRSATRTGAARAITARRSRSIAGWRGPRRRAHRWRARDPEAPMRRLILVCHATAVDEGPKGSDFHRRLKKRGRREAQLMAERVAATVGKPDQIFSSPADRALETARLFADRLGVPVERVTVREELYGGLESDDFLHI